MTQIEALEHIALAVYQRRRANALLEYGSSDGDMNVAKDVFSFFKDYHGSGHTTLENVKFEDYSCYLPLYEFLVTQIEPEGEHGSRLP